jgi:hypothetical protein
LARERRLRGLSLEDVAAATRIPRRSLERLEAGAFDRNPDGFTRGFVRAVADAIGLDPSEALARLLGEAVPERGRPGSPPGWLWIACALAVGLAAAAASLPGWWPRGGEAPAAQAPRAAERTRRDFVRELASAARAEAEAGARRGPLPSPDGHGDRRPGAAHRRVR